jgi:L-threonylcarbamoyladenylate synthase
MQTLDIQHTPLEEILQTTIAVLRAGGLVIFPTETTYGAGVDALNQAGVDKLLAYKSRREGKPLSIAVSDIEMAARYVDVNDAARALYERFLPGPVTVISHGKHLVASGVESEFGTLGVRLPDYPLVIELVKRLGVPITATSANGSGAKRPYAVTDIFADLSDKQHSLIDLVLDAGELPHNPPSTVIDTTLSTPVVFRQGEIQIIEPTAVTTLQSASEEETRTIAQRLVLKHWNDVKEKGLIIGLNGSLGMGKTIFAKGVAQFLQISETITSPTYSYIEEYDFVRHGVKGAFFHLDVWKVDSEAEAERLDLPRLLKPNHVIVIEWVSTIASVVQNLLSTHGLPYIEVEFRDDDSDPSKRTLEIKE